jgi:hypothetical protein
MLKHCAANRKRRLSALSNIGPYIYDVKISNFKRSCIYIRHYRRLRVKMDIQEVGGGCGDWMELTQDRDRWRALVSTVKKLRVP